MVQDGTYANPWLVGAANVEGAPEVGDTDAYAGQWVECSTDVLAEMMALGMTPSLPQVMVPVGIMAAYDLDDVEDASAFGDALEIVSIEYVGDEEVQCIEVDDPDHMYITDGFIPTHNTSNIVFLKSTDDSMLDTLEKMSGKTHQVRIESKMITRDIEKMWMRNEGHANITLNVKEEPVIAYSDMAFLAERNSIVFRAGDNPIWNRNETILPMSWRLFKTKIVHPGHDYSLQTIPTLSSAIDFDVRRNQPDFNKMLEKRLAQAVATPDAMEMYKEAYGYEDYDIEQLDPDVYSDAIMDIVNARIADQKQMEAKRAVEEPYSPASYRGLTEEVTENAEAKREAAIQAKRAKLHEMKRFAGRKISKADIVTIDGNISGRGMEQTIIDAYCACRGAFERDHTNFSYRDGTLFGKRGADGITPWYIRKRDESRNLQVINSVKNDLESRTYAENDINMRDLNNTATWEVSDDFYRFLAEQDAWTFANGEFERQMAQRFRD